MSWAKRCRRAISKATVMTCRRLRGGLQRPLDAARRGGCTARWRQGRWPARSGCCSRCAVHEMLTADFDHREQAGHRRGGDDGVGEAALREPVLRGRSMQAATHWNGTASSSNVVTGRSGWSRRRQRQVGVRCVRSRMRVLAMRNGESKTRSLPSRRQTSSRRSSISRLARPRWPHR